MRAEEEKRPQRGNSGVEGKSVRVRASGTDWHLEGPGRCGTAPARETSFSLGARFRWERG